MKPKYELILTKYAVWSEVDNDSDDTPSGGITTLENFLSRKSPLILVSSKPSHVRLDYIVEAATWEEVRSIVNLRTHGDQYQPAGEAEPCPKCSEFMYFPEGSGCCPKCGKIC